MQTSFHLITISMAFTFCLQSAAQSFWKGSGAVTDTGALHSGLLYSRPINALFVSTFNMGIFRNDGKDSTWHHVLSLPKDQPVFSLYQSKNGYLFAGGYGKIFRSDPAGEKWNEIPINFTQVKGFAEDLNGNLFLCSADSGGILRSDDNGQSWKPFVNGLPSNYVNNIAGDRNGNILCTVINDRTDIHGGLFCLNSSTNQWVKKNISVVLDDNTLYTVKVNSIQSVAFTPGGMVYLSLDGGILNFAIYGLFKNSIAGVLAGSAWMRETWNDTLTSPITLQFDQLFASETGHIFASRISSSLPGVYSKMKYSPDWFECSAGLPPVTKVKGYFAESGDGTVFVTTGFSNRIFLTGESKPGKKSQNIRFNALAPTRLYESAILSASSSSELLVRFKSMNTDKARIDGNSVHALGLGEVAIKAWVNGNDTLYYDETSQVLTINKARNEIQIEPLQSFPEGDSSLNVSARATSGEAVKLTITRGNAWFRGTKISYQGPGKIQFIATEPGNDTYEAADTVWTELCVFPKKPFILSDTLSGTVLLSSSSERGNQWFVNNTRTGQEERSITPLIPGNYTLQINIDGCLSEFSEPFVFSVTGTKDPGAENPFIAYPQPVHEKLFIKLKEPGAKTPVRIFVIDCLGNIIISQDEHVQGPVTLDMSDLLPGWYILQIAADDKIHYTKIIKN
jgi:hypothetical protein